MQECFSDDTLAINFEGLKAYLIGLKVISLLRLYHKNND